MKEIGTGFYRHHDLFQGRVPGPLTQAIDGALHLTGTVGDRSQRVGHGQAQVVVAMHREHGFIGIGNAFHQLADGFTILMGHGITHCVRDIDGAGTGINGSLNHAAQKIQFRSAGILTGELHIITAAAGALDRFHGLFQHLLRCHPQFVLHVDG